MEATALPLTDQEMNYIKERSCEASTCEICGFETAQNLCTIRCQNCGFEMDCSDPK
jgi:hypothetical protein